MCAFHFCHVSSHRLLPTQSADCYNIYDQRTLYGGVPKPEVVVFDVVGHILAVYHWLWVRAVNQYGCCQTYFFQGALPPLRSYEIKALDRCRARLLYKIRFSPMTGFADFQQTKKHRA